MKHAPSSDSLLQLRFKEVRVVLTWLWCERVRHIHLGLNRVKHTCAGICCLLSYDVTYMNLEMEGHNHGQSYACTWHKRFSSVCNHTCSQLTHWIEWDARKKCDPVCTYPGRLWQFCPDFVVVIHGGMPGKVEMTRNISFTSIHRNVLLHSEFRSSSIKYADIRSTKHTHCS